MARFFNKIKAYLTLSNKRRSTPQPDPLPTPNQEQRPSTPESHDQPLPPHVTPSPMVIQQRPPVIKISRNKRVVKHHKRVTRESDRDEANDATLKHARPTYRKKMPHKRRRKSMPVRPKFRVVSHS